MAIEKMVLLKIVGSLEEMHPILKQLILCENVHLNTDNNNAYNNNYFVHQYEADLISSSIHKPIDYDNMHNECIRYEQIVEDLCNGLGLDLKVDKKVLFGNKYSIEDVKWDLDVIQSEIGNKVEQIKNKKAQIEKLLKFREKIDCIYDKSIEFDKIADLNFFEYEIGALSSENKSRLKKNYENLTAIVLKLGNIKSSVEDMYIIIYPKQFKDETKNILKSLNWNQLNIPDGLSGNSAQMIEQIDKKIEILQNEIVEVSNILEIDKEENQYILNRIFNTLILEKKIAELEKLVDYGHNLFVLNAWVKEKDKIKVEESIGTVTNKFVITEKTANEVGGQVKPPTNLKNNWFAKPFELIVKMYGMPSYNEIDPTPFLAVTFCFMFGIMFGDIGQGLVYFIAGFILYNKYNKMKMAGSLVMRLGVSSIIFGFVYGSFFGLEQEEIPWLPSLIGKPLDPKNIPMILISGVVIGVVLLTVSFVYGILNSLRRGDIEEGLFGKNGVSGYLFFISLVFTGVAITGIINLPVVIPISILLLSLIIIILKEPVTNLFLNKKPLIYGGVGAYLTESIFEGVETVLNALSNAISFIRVGAFALNHAGLFLAFLVMSEMTNNIVIKIVILFLGNVLILTLEGLVVFIQGLRLQYYEMFSKYFNGDGIEYNPIKLKK
nr:V-type ATPase 116kDa subunit family protein [Sedimentibacter sp.]